MTITGRHRPRPGTVRGHRAGRNRRNRKAAAWGCLACLLAGACAPPEASPAAQAAADAANPVRVVVVTMFERGQDEGDEPGEFQFWKTRRSLTERFAFPQGHHDLYYNAESRILGVVTGIGTAKSAASIMALGLDPRFDLRQAYWLVAGIAGIDPEDASIGSAVWSAYLVDGDLGYEIDAREIPSGWRHGFFPLGTAFPGDPDRPEARGEVFVANAGLRDWAFELTRDIVLQDDAGLAGGPGALRQPPQRPQAAVRRARRTHRRDDLLAWHCEKRLGQ